MLPGGAWCCLVLPGAASHLYGAAGATGAARHMYGAAGDASHLYGAAGAACASGAAQCCLLLPDICRVLPVLPNAAWCCQLTLLICPVLPGVAGAAW